MENLQYEKQRNRSECKAESYILNKGIIGSIAVEALCCKAKPFQTVLLTMY
jgi:hypothetical protein